MTERPHDNPTLTIIYLVTYAFDCLFFSQVDDYILPARRGKSRPSQFDLRFVEELRGAAHSNVCLGFTRCTRLYCFRISRQRFTAIA